MEAILLQSLDASQALITDQRVQEDLKMRNSRIMIALVAIFSMSMLSACDNFLYDNTDGKQANRSIDVPAGCDGFVQDDGTTRWDQIPGEPTCDQANTADPATTTDATQAPTSATDATDGNSTEDTTATPVSMALCLGDKVSTVNEVSEAQLQRMEITTGDVIHLDYYNTVNGERKDAVSVIVHAGEAAVLAGYGSEWQFPMRDCGDFDFIGDASNYANGRLVGGPNDWGHSGLVYASLADFLNGNDPVVNVRNINPQDPSVSQPILWEDTDNGVIS